MPRMAGMTAHASQRAGGEGTESTGDSRRLAEEASLHWNKRSHGPGSGRAWDRRSRRPNVFTLLMKSGFTFPSSYYQPPVSLSFCECLCASYSRKIPDKASIGAKRDSILYITVSNFSRAPRKAKWNGYRISASGLTSTMRRLFHLYV